MRTLLWIFLGLTSIVLGTTALLQTEWAKNLAKHKLIHILQEEGIEVDIGTVGGSFPYAIDLHQLHVRTQSGWLIEVQRLQLRFSPLYLFKKELHFSSVVADQVHWISPPVTEDATIPFVFPSSFSYALSIDHFHILEIESHRTEKPLLHLQGHLRIRKKGTIGLLVEEGSEARLLLSSKPRAGTKARLKIHHKEGDLILIAKGPRAFFQQNGWEGTLYAKKRDAQGEVHFILSEEKIEAQGHVDIPHVITPVGTIDKIHGSFLIQGPTKNWSGSAHFSALFHEQTWTAAGQYASVEGGILWPDLQIQSIGTRISSALTVFWDGTVEGKSDLLIENLHGLFQPDLYGVVQAQIQWNRNQEVSVEANLSEVHYHSLYSKAVHLHVDLSSLRKEALFTCEECQYRELRLSFLSLKTQERGDRWPFHLFTEGEWGKPLDLTLDGIGYVQDGTFFATLSQASGSFFNHPYYLSEPIQSSFSSQELQIPSFTLLFGNASIELSLQHQLEETLFHLALQKLPLDFLSLNPLDVSVTGFLSGSTDWKETKGESNGNFSWSLTDLEVLHVEDATPLSAHGTLEGNFAHQRLRSRALFFLHEAPLLSVDSSLPMVIHLWPMHASFLTTPYVEAKLSYEGQLEELLDFFNLGVHSIRGNVVSRFQCTGNLTHPLVTGQLIWKDGFYENYLTGTTLTQIDAHLKAEGDHASLLSFTAKDRDEEGLLSAQGALQFSLAESFPFAATLHLDTFELAQIEWARSKASGQLNIQGTLESAEVRGNLLLEESTLSIPSHIPKSLPNLQVTYRGAYKPPPPSLTPSASLYPLHLDIRVDAPSKIYVSGRGLISEWGGQLHLGGTESAIAINGKLELLTGGFSFSGRDFKLSEGSLLFTGKPGAMPLLNLAATVETSGVVVTARLKGALNAPQITFQSQPPLPVSAILAYLLFGQDISEINSLQALQIANSAAALSSDDANVLESTRRSLGVDRLRVVTSPSGGDEEQDSIALQVGKYIAQGIIVSVSQGTEDSSTNLSIEVELQHGFVFQLESQQEQEQGKFTLKWTLSY